MADEQISADALKERVAALPADDQRALAEEIAFRLARRKEAFTTDEQDVWDALSDELAQRHGALPIPLPVFAKAFGRKKYSDTAAAIVQYTNNSCGMPLRRPAKRAVLRVVMGCLVENVISREMLPLPKIVIDSATLLPFAVEECFPGYAAARLLHRVTAPAA